MHFCSVLKGNDTEYGSGNVVRALLVHTGPRFDPQNQKSKTEGVCKISSFEAAF